MRFEELPGVRLAGICAALPSEAAANAEPVAKVTGIRTRRIAAPGTTPLDLCVAAAERLLTGVSREEIGAVLFVSFTQPDRMPCGACQAQARLRLPRDVIAFDVALACSGWGYAIYLGGLLARQTGRKTLVLDGDVQSACMREGDAATAPILADAGTAALIEPCADAPAWRFAFLVNGAEGAALRLKSGGSIEMDGFGVFRFVSIEVTQFIREFMESAKIAAGEVAAFVPHQANVFMVKKLAEALGIAEDRLWISGDELGNSASATIPVTLAWVGRHQPAARKVLFSGFGGGLSACVGEIALNADCRLEVIEYGE